MPWFYNSLSGELTHATGIDALAYEAAIHSGLGWHELHIADSASETQAAAEAVKEVPGGQTPTTSIATGLANAPGGLASQAAKSALPGLSQIGDFFQRLTQASTWVRVGEVLLGLILLGVAAARITGAQNFVSSAVKARVP